MEKELVRWRHLLWQLVKRDVKGRYQGSFMGLWWSFLNPLALITIYVVVFSQIVKGKWDFGGTMVDYAVYLCAGLIPWLFVSEALLSSCNSILGNAPLLKQVIFPKQLLPLQCILSVFFNFLILMVIFLCFMVVRGMFPLRTIVLLPVVVVFQLLILIGPGYFLATLNVFARDTVHLLSTGLHLLFWATPIIYPPDFHVLDKPIFRWWFTINPASQLVRIYREVLLYQQLPSWGPVLYLLLLGGFFYFLGKWAFTRSQMHFTDEL